MVENKVEGVKMMERLRRKGEVGMVENKVEGGENDGEIENYGEDGNH